ncbi:MAG TPA: hypothetical protein VGF73_10215 [Chthoniobacterales bacterium]
MNRFLCALLVLGMGLAFPQLARGQDSFSGVDLLYPELAHPEQDAKAALSRHDFRFIAIDRYGKNVPGVERYPRLKQKQGTKFVPQPFRIFATRSQNFSFGLRARAYAEEYNRILLRELLKRPRRK